MKIGIFIAPSHTVPPEERNILAPWVLVKELADGLVKIGKHTVYLFAASGSQTTAILKDFGIGPTIRFEKRVTPDEFGRLVLSDEEILVRKMIDTAKKEKIDILHLHQIKRMYPFLIQKAAKDLKFVFTLHDPITQGRYEEIKKIDALGNCFFVTISVAQKGNYSFNHTGTVYNGLSLQTFHFNDEAVNMYLAAGRIVPEKGYKEAITAIKRTESKLLIAGQVYEDRIKDKMYWEQRIKPDIDGVKINHVGGIGHNNIEKIYQMAKALLFPILWEEPFGLVMTEAMACGTPVIAYARGSVPEVVVDGVTGFIVNPSDQDVRGDWIIKKTGIDGLVEAVKRLNAMSEEEYKKMRFACRKHVEEKFTVEKMVEGYERVYERILNI